MKLTAYNKQLQLIVIIGNDLCLLACIVRFGLKHFIISLAFTVVLVLEPKVLTKFSFSLIFESKVPMVLVLGSKHFIILI